MRFPLRAAVAAALLAVCTPAAWAQTTLPASGDAFTSPNVKYLGSIKDDVGLTTGAKIIGNRMFVTSGKNISIYDISVPAKPTRVGLLKVNASWQNEEVPTNGKVLAVASDTYNLSAEGGCLQALRVTGCTQFFDVRDPGNIKELPAFPKSNHTVECVLDCAYFWGSGGAIIDASKILDTPAVAPKEIGNWKTAAKNQGATQSECHHIRELRPGVVLTACRPFTVLSINSEDGGSPANPKVLAKGKAAKFVHSARWPNAGTDDMVLIGGELNLTARCEFNDSEFSTYSAKAVNTKTSNEFEGPLDQYVPTNGTYVDGGAPAGELGCSVHWFQEHPTFKNGGLVALSEFENGVRFLQVTPQGEIKEQGWFVSLGSSSSSPKWAPDGKTVYSIDYHRGIDILEYTGQLYVPDAQGRVVPEKGRTAGTSAGPPARALRAGRRGQEGTVARLRMQGWSPAFCQLSARRGA